MNFVASQQMCGKFQLIVASSPNLLLSNTLFRKSSIANSMYKICLPKLLPENQNIQSRLLTAIITPTHQQITSLILDQKSANEALQTFQWASKIPAFSHTPSTYRALIHKLCTFRQFNTVEQLLDEMPKRISYFPDDDIFVTMVRGYGRARMTKEVIRVLHLVSKFGKCEPSLKVMNSILDYLVKVDIDIAREFYRKKIMGSGLKGDDYTYGILMKGFCLTNRIGDGFKLLQLMKSSGVKANAVVYNTLIYALCKNGKVGRARSLMSEMTEFTDVTYNTMISAYCNENSLIQGLVMLEKCFGNGLLPDVVSLTKLLEILCNAGRISEAVDLLDRFEERGGSVDVVAHNTLVKGFVKARKMKAGCGFLKKMEMKGCLPNTDTYNVLIGGFCELGMLDSALDMFHEMKRVGANWDIDTFKTLTYGLCSRGRTGDGIKIFELMNECRKSYNYIGPYNIIIYGLYKENRLDEAVEFLENMSNLFPRAVDRSLSILRLSQETGRIVEAKNVFDTIRVQGIVPNALIYASLVQGFCTNGFMKEAVELINEMIGDTYFPSSSTFDALISGFCRQGKIGSALKFVDDMKLRGIVSDSESYGIVIKGLCNHREMEQAFVLVMEMVERGLKPDYKLWNSLVLVMFKEKDMLLEHELFQGLILA